MLQNMSCKDRDNVVTCTHRAGEPISKDVIGTERKGRGTISVSVTIADLDLSCVARVVKEEFDDPSRVKVMAYPIRNTEESAVMARTTERVGTNGLKPFMATFETGVARAYDDCALVG